MEFNKYIDMINSLNGQQQKIFNDFCERIESYDVEDDPFYLYIAGEAGTGKSFLLRLMIEFVKRIPKQSGQELNKPVHITVAPTGVAAYLVNGSTIESAFSLISDRKSRYSKNSDSKNADLRFMYEDLKVIFLDEVSMLGTNLFTKMNFRLQDIMQYSNQRQDVLELNIYWTQGQFLKRLDWLHKNLNSLSMSRFKIVLIMIYCVTLVNRWCCKLPRQIVVS